MKPKAVKKLEQGKVYVCVKCRKYYAMGRFGIMTFRPKIQLWVNGASPHGLTWPMHNVPGPRFYELCTIVQVSSSLEAVSIGNLEVNWDG